MATSEGIPSSIDIEFLELNDNPYLGFILVYVFICERNIIGKRCVSVKGQGLAVP